MEVIELPFAKVGFNICYEAEIPECAATLTEQRAESILCPSFTFTEFGFWRVRHCAAARAIENQRFAAGVNRVGADGNGVQHDGESAALDYLGMPLAALGTSAGSAAVSLDLAALREFCERFPVHLDADAFTLTGVAAGSGCPQEKSPV